MVTQVVSIPRHWHGQHADDGRREFVSSVFRGIHQWFCGLRGHEEMLHLEPDRMCLECASCGHQTPGWHLTVSHPPTAPRGIVRVGPRRVSANALRRCA